MVTVTPAATFTAEKLKAHFKRIKASGFSQSDRSYTLDQFVFSLLNRTPDLSVACTNIRKAEIKTEVSQREGRINLKGMTGSGEGKSKRGDEVVRRNNRQIDFLTVNSGSSMVVHHGLHKRYATTIEHSGKKHARAPPPGRLTVTGSRHGLHETDGKCYVEMGCSK